MCRNVQLEELDPACVGVQFYSLNTKKKKQKPGLCARKKMCFGALRKATALQH